MRAVLTRSWSASAAAAAPISSSIASTPVSSAAGSSSPSTVSSEATEQMLSRSVRAAAAAAAVFAAAFPLLRVVAACGVYFFAYAAIDSVKTSEFSAVCPTTKTSRMSDSATVSDSCETWLYNLRISRDMMRSGCICVWNKAWTISSHTANQSL